MSDAASPTDQSLRSLDACGCCAGLEALTPLEIENRPGLSAIAYRVGTHASFKESLLAGLSTSRRPSLQGLSNRNDEDLSIALLDAWATVADVLTFYQERIANESYLRTATERFSLLQLARLIGYELRPGVAASVYLSFAVEDAPGAPGEASVPIGTRVQSIPGPGELPQTFETAQAIEARAAWNAIRPRLTQEHPIDPALAEYAFEGIATGLRVGDGLLIVPESNASPVFRLVSAVSPQPEQKRTLVQVQEPASTPASSSPVPVFKPAFVHAASPLSQSYLARKSIRAADFRAEALIFRFLPLEIFANLKAVQPPPPSILAFRQRASIFGHNAPPWNASLPAPWDTEQSCWVDHYTLGSYDTGGFIYLDTTYPSLIKDSWLVLKSPSKASLFGVSAVDEVRKDGFTLGAKVSRLKLTAPPSSSNTLSDFKIVETMVFAQSEELKLARLPIETPVSGAQIDLDGWVEGLYAGQTIVVCGEQEVERGVQACEVATIADILHQLEDGYTQIALRSGLQHSYVRSTVTIQGNVCLANHGETKTEVLGSGNTSQPFQRFSLRQNPLTYLSAPTPSGAASTLEVRVNAVLWHEVPSLLGHGPAERVYITRRDNEGRTMVTFGDGQMGARPPSGQENVTALYRKGIGLAGLVAAGQLSLLSTRPHGVRGVSNPLPASGAADPETLDEARSNAPLTILTLDRIVSLQDYQDFARAFAGIAKAHAGLDGTRRGVLVTVAGPAGAVIDPSGPTFTNLLSAILQASDPSVPVKLMSYRQAFFQVNANLRIDPDFIQEEVLEAVETSLRAAFSFEARSFGQAVSPSEVILVIQKTPGVIAVDLDSLPITVDLEPPGVPVPDPQAASLLTMDPRPVNFGIMP
jgi:predicted phage baseplate assembly protein